jgi:hypothetical protein
MNNLDRLYNLFYNHDMGYYLNQSQPIRSAVYTLKKQLELRHKYSMVFYLLICTSNSMNTHRLIFYSSSYSHKLAQNDAEGLCDLI